MKTRFAAVLATALLLAACGGPSSPPPAAPDSGDDPGTPPGSPAAFRQAGLVILSEVREAGESGFVSVSGSGSFVEAAAPAGQPLTGDPFEGSLGRCFIGDERPRLQAPFTAPAGDATRAGEPLTVTAGGAPYAQLAMDEALERYFVQGMPAVPLPDRGLSLSVPGDEDGFPAMADKAFPESEAFSLSAPAADADVSLDTVFSWDPHSPEAVVMVAVSGGSSARAFVCLTPDTGSFSLSADAHAALAEAGFTTGSLEAAGRFTYTRHLEENAELGLMIARIQVPAEDPEDDFDDGVENDFGGGF